MFKIKDGSKLELQTPETMKLFSSTKKINRQNKNVRSLEVVEVVDNKSQQKFAVFYTFTPSKSYAYLLNVESSNLVLLEVWWYYQEHCNTEFDEIIKTFTDQYGRPLKIEDKVNLTLLINKQK